MTRKVWEGLGALLVVVIVINVAVASLRPYLPYLGAAVSIIIVGALVRVFWYKKKLW